MELPTKQVIEWLLNGVTPREVQERLSWLGFCLKIEEILEIEDNYFNRKGGRKYNESKI